MTWDAPLFIIPRGVDWAVLVVELNEIPFQ